MAEPDLENWDRKLEESERRKQNAVDLWDDGEREIETISAKTGLRIHEVRQALIEKNLITFEGDDPKLQVADVAADDLGTTAIFDLEILSVQGAMSLPVRMSSRCARCGSASPDGDEVKLEPEDMLFLSPPQRQDHINLKALQAHEENAGCGRRKSATVFRLEPRESVDYAVLQVGDVHDSREGFAGGFDDTRLDLHLLMVRPPTCGRIRVRAKIVQHPKTLRTTLIAYEYRPLEELPAEPKLDENERAAFAGWARNPMETIRRQVAPDMVERDLVKEARVLVLHSPRKIPDVDGKKELRGGLIEVLFGDTTTNKSESAEDTHRLGFGPKVQAENAARTGLTYTLSQNSSNEWSLTWGILPRNHGKWAFLDGVERWSNELQGNLRAAMRDQEVSVDKVLHGRRPCAVRLTITANPDKDMAEYPFPCAAIGDIRTFRGQGGKPSGPDIARVDFWLPFSLEDISARAVADRTAQDRPYPPDLFLKKILWVWSRRPSDISYQDPAKAAIRECAAKLMEEFGCASMPIAHRGLRDTVCRVAVAVAAVRFSTSDAVQLVVTPEHVAEADSFLRRMYELLELGDYKLHSKAEVRLDGGEALSVAIDIGEMGLQTVHLLAKESMSARQIAAKLTVNPDTIQDLYGRLKDHALIETTRGKGSELTSRGMRFFQWTWTATKLFSVKSPTSQKSVGETTDNNFPEGGVDSESSVAKGVPP